MTTGATVSLTTNNSLTVNAAASAYIYGMTFATTGAAGSGQMLILTNQGSGSSGQSWSLYENCSFQLLNTSGSAMSMSINNSPQSVAFVNCTVKFANTSCTVSAGGSQISLAKFRRVNFCKRFGCTTYIIQRKLCLPCTTLFLRRIDFSSLPGNIYNSTSSGTLGSIIVKDCKLNATDDNPDAHSVRIDGSIRALR